jgi:hypothetical protein
MADDPIADFHEEFFQSIYVAADSDGQYAEDAFFELYCEQLVDAGEFASFERVAWAGSRGARIDGYGGDPAESGGTLSLIVCDFHQDRSLSSLTGTELEAALKRPANFLKRALDPVFRAQLEETSPVFGLADMVAARWERVNRIRLFVLSNRQLSSRVDSVAVVEFEGRPVSASVWDIGRLGRYMMSGRGVEDIEIDLVGDFGGPLSVLPAHVTDANYESYLAVIPGQQLADIYDRYGTRLLEQNVRVFLQARGKVNRQIRDTIERSPEMFFAYNNGITATAEGVEFETGKAGSSVSSLKNLQIVNGGQTTASLHAALLKKTDLSRVHVQMKLSIIDPELATEIVPRISEYANSQNKVSATDFFSNHPFHIRVEQFSRRVQAPSPDGVFRQSHWFYERARGQYQNARSLLTPAKRKAFDLENPKHQKFDKSDLAKFAMPWEGLPHVVARGAQKNFVEFAKLIEKAWEKSSEDFNEDYFKRASAMALIFRETEKIVSAQPWYTGGGTRAKIVPYAIFLLSEGARLRGGEIDLLRVWKLQSIPDVLAKSLLLASKAANQVIYFDHAEQANRAEYAKNQACTARVAQAKVEWPERFDDLLISADEVREQTNDAKKDQKVVSGIEAQAAVVTAGAEFWRDVNEWGQKHRLLSPREAGVLAVANAIPVRLPSEKQALVLVDLLAKLNSEGCELTLDVI